MALKKLALQALDDMKAQDVCELDVHLLTDISDWMLICTATSKRHLQSIAEHLSQVSKAHQQQPIGIEGKSQDEWILVDLGDVIVHVMTASTREHYSLEKLWRSDDSGHSTENRI